MIYLFLFEDFKTQGYMDQSNNPGMPRRGSRVAISDYRISDYMKKFSDKKLLEFLAIELEYEKRTSKNKEIDVDDFLNNLNINDKNISRFDWSLVLNKNKRYEEMTDEQFMLIYNDLTKENT